MDNKLESPLNANERYLYNICIRLDALIHIMSSFVDVYAKQNNLATTNNTETQITPKKRKKTGGE